MRSLSTRPWFRYVARTGIGARGVVYLLLTYLALDIALHGSSPAQTDSQGALHEVVRQPAGPELLAVLGAGLAAYGLWRLLQAVTGEPSPPQSRALGKRLGWLAIAVAYIGLCAQVIELLLGRSSGSSVSSNPRPWVAIVLGWPGGPEILGALAVGLMIAGLGLAIWGFGHDYDKDLHFEGLRTRWRAMVRTFGGIGNLARGFLMTLVGGYLMNAALASKASHAKSVDSALQALTHHSYGAVLIGFVAAGLLGFAIYSFADARLRRL